MLAKLYNYTLKCYINVTNQEHFPLILDVITAGLMCNDLHRDADTCNAIL